MRMGADGVPPAVVGQDGAVLASGDVGAAVCSDTSTVQRVVRTLVGPVVVLPATQLSGFHGFPLIAWSDGVADRVGSGIGPMLDRPTLSLWESWPSGMRSSPPPSPLRILGFASTASWRWALRATRELRGFGVTCVLSSKRPSAIALAEADVAGVYVVRVGEEVDEVLVHGRPPATAGPRMVATRYWEERLLAHALRVGVFRPPPSMALP